MHFSAPRLCYHLLELFFTNSTIRLFKPAPRASSIFGVEPQISIPPGLR